jgi:hypothetical protein
MKHLLWLISIVFLFNAEIAVAQERVPSGCFVTDEERVKYLTPPPCFNEERQTIINWNPGNGYTTEQLRQFYGFQYGSMVVFAYDLFTQLQQSGAALNSKLALERKLRKACGSKCRRIK